MNGYLNAEEPVLSLTWTQVCLQANDLLRPCSACRQARRLYLVWHSPEKGGSEELSAGLENAMNFLEPVLHERPAVESGSWHGVSGPSGPDQLPHRCEWRLKIPRRRGETGLGVRANSHLLHPHRNIRTDDVEVRAVLLFLPGPPSQYAPLPADRQHLWMTSPSMFSL
eukprot:753411-Hanusia_phi.AAC.2